MKMTTTPHGYITEGFTRGWMIVLSELAVPACYAIGGQLIVRNTDFVANIAQDNVEKLTTRKTVDGNGITSTLLRGFK